MERICENCGQKIDDKDKYCKYCGCPIPQQEVKLKMSKKQIDDKIQEEKTLVLESDIVLADVFGVSKILIKKEGVKSRLRMKNIIYIFISVLISVASAVIALFIKQAKINEILAFSILFVSIIFIFLGIAIAVEKYFNIVALNSLKDRTIVIRKFGFKKTPEFMVQDVVFEMDITAFCEKCDGDIKGNLHFERIENQLVVVCNINRKHVWKCNEKDFFDTFLTSSETSKLKDITVEEEDEKTVKDITVEEEIAK